MYRAIFRIKNAIGQKSQRDTDGTPWLSQIELAACKFDDFFFRVISVACAAGALQDNTEAG